MDITENLNNNFYIPKDDSLKSIIHSAWHIDHFTSFQKENIIPKGVIEIIFNFSGGPPIQTRLNNKEYYLSNCFINGFNTAPIELQLPRRHSFFGIRFQPLAIKKILRSPASEFSDITVDLTLVDASFNSLWQQLAEQDNFNSRIIVFLNWAKKNLIEWQPQEQLLNNFLYAGDQHELSVKELANSLCYSPRHLSRKIFEASGMNTEEILLYKKYLHALDLIHHTDLSLTSIAYQSHFSDQSHFIRSFKAYTNITPGEYKKNKGYVKGHIYENVR